jgi:hypothetical protein
MAKFPRINETHEIRMPGDDTDYSSWGERLYEPDEIMKIIHNSGLVLPRVS